MAKRASGGAGRIEERILAELQRLRRMNTAAYDAAVEQIRRLVRDSQTR